MSEHGQNSMELERLIEAQIAACGKAIQSLAHSADSRQSVAERIVSFLYENFRTQEAGASSCILARCFQTTSYASLPLDYQYAADRLLDTVEAHREMRCLALLATRGDKNTWNDVATSTAHLAIPLPSVEVVRRAPMIARLLEQFNVPLDELVLPATSNEFWLQRSNENFNIFHVPEAWHSPFIPAQDSFVQPFGVRSVIGMGGILPDGELFVVILFTRVEVSREVAELFRTLATDVREALSPFAPNRVFSGSSGRW